MGEASDATDTQILHVELLLTYMMVPCPINIFIAHVIRARVV